MANRSNLKNSDGTWNDSAMRLTGLTERTFGVELELLYGNGPRSMSGLAQAITEQSGVAVAAQGYNHRVSRTWKIVPDGSVSGGCELVSPILKGEDGLAQVEAICGALVEIGVKVNRSTGLHVHHDASDLDVNDLRALCRIINRYEKVIDGLVSPSRRRGQNSYTGAFSPRELERIERCRSKSEMTHAGHRYRNLNLQALGRHGTVEFRQHQGSFEGQKIVAWILLTQGLVEMAKAGRGRRGQVGANRQGLKNLLTNAGLTTCRPHGHMIDPAHQARVKATCRYLWARAKHFAQRGAVGCLNLETTTRRAATARERVEQATRPSRTQG